MEKNKLIAIIVVIILFFGIIFLIFNSMGNKQDQTSYNETQKPITNGNNHNIQIHPFWATILVIMLIVIGSVGTIFVSRKFFDNSFIKKEEMLVDDFRKVFESRLMKDDVIEYNYNYKNEKTPLPNSVEYKDQQITYPSATGEGFILGDCLVSNKFKHIKMMMTFVCNLNEEKKLIKFGKLSYRQKKTLSQYLEHDYKPRKYPLTSPKSELGRNLALAQQSGLDAKDAMEQVSAMQPYNYGSSFGSDLRNVENFNNNDNENINQEQKNHDNVDSNEESYYKPNYKKKYSRRYRR